MCGALSCTLWLVSVRQSKDADHSKSQAKLLGGGHFIFLAFLTQITHLTAVKILKKSHDGLENFRRNILRRSSFV